MKVVMNGTLNSFRQNWASCTVTDLPLSLIHELGVNALRWYPQHVIRDALILECFQIVSSHTVCYPVSPFVFRPVDPEASLSVLSFLLILYVTRDLVRYGSPTEN